jgi:hypothetical protein
MDDNSIKKQIINFHKNVEIYNKLLEKYDYLLKDFYIDFKKEWIPSLTDKNWVTVTLERHGKEKNKIIKFECKKYENIPKIQISIDQIMIDKIDDMIKNNLQIEENVDYSSDNMIYYIIKLQKDDKSYIFDAKTPLQTVIKKKIKNRTTSKTNELNNFDNLCGIKCILMGCYMGKLVQADLNNLKKQYEDKKTIFSIYKSNILDVINNEIIECEKEKRKEILEIQQYNIYKIYQEDHIEQQYICGSYDVINSKNIPKLLKNIDECIKFEKNKLSIELLAKIDCKLECYGKVFVDEYIDKCDSIKNGLNRYYNVVDPDLKSDKIKEKSFLLVQQNIMNKYWINDLFKTKKGYIACIQFPENKNYLFSEKNMDVLSKMNYFYSLRIVSPDDERMMELLKITRYFNIKIDILANDLAINKLSNLFTELINKYPKSQIINGVNNVIKSNIRKFAIMNAKKK